MTFIPNVLTNIDTNNSCVNLNPTSGQILFVGTQTITTGYNTIILTIQSTIGSVPGGIQIYMYADGEVPTSAFYTDTYITNTQYIKNFTITKKNYRIQYTSLTGAISSDTLNINSRLSTELDSSITNNNTTSFNFSEEFALDAFGKLRVSNPVTILDLRFPGQSNGTTSFLNNTLSVCSSVSVTNPSFTASATNSQLLITGNGNGWYISQSRKFCTYQPGKSLLFMASGIICPSDSNFNYYIPGYTGRIGYYTNNIFAPTINTNYTTPYNGLYFEYGPSGMSICVVNNGSIKPYLQSEWNLDTMDGTGPSGLTLKFTNTQLFVMDMEWLGVGRVRFGFYAYGKIQYCHQIVNLNILKNPYTGTINLPVRYELIGSVSASQQAYMLQICSTVISEGGFNPIGKPFSVSSGANFTSISTGIETPVLILRGSMNYSSSITNNNFHVNIIPNQITMINDSNSNLTLLTVRLYRAENIPAWTISPWYEVGPSLQSTTPYLSAAQYATTITGFTPGLSTVLDYKYFYGNLSSSINNLQGIFNDQIMHLTSNVQGQSDYLVITATNLSSNNSKVYVSLNWTEVY
jgi:hypothetical protein